MCLVSSVFEGNWCIVNDNHVKTLNDSVHVLQCLSLLANDTAISDDTAVTVYLLVRTVFCNFCSWLITDRGEKRQRSQQRHLPVDAHRRRRRRRKRCRQIDAA